MNNVNPELRYDLDNKSGVIASLGQTIKDSLSVISTTASALNEVAGTAESLARTGHGMATRNEKYVADKGNALHQARMSQLHADIQRMEAYNEALASNETDESISL